jgi:hypothetical protein
MKYKISITKSIKVEADDEDKAIIKAGEQDAYWWTESQPDVEEINDDDGWTIVCAEDGEDFQHYIDGNGKPIKAGEPIGIEKGDTLKLLSGVYFQ